MSLDITALHNEIIYLQQAMSLFSLSLSAPPTPSFYADSKATPLPLFSLKRRGRKKSCFYLFSSPLYLALNRPHFQMRRSSFGSLFQLRFALRTAVSKKFAVQERNISPTPPPSFGAYSSLIPLSLRSFAKKNPFELEIFLSVTRFLF